MFSLNLGINADIKLRFTQKKKKPNKKKQTIQVTSRYNNRLVFNLRSNLFENQFLNLQVVYKINFQIKDLH